VVFGALFGKKNEPAQTGLKQPTRPMPAGGPAAPAVPSPGQGPVTVAVSPPAARKEEDLLDDVLVVSEAVNLAVAEEAAVLYANGLTDQAIATLEQFLKDNPGSREAQPWFMLFDLYLQKGDKKAFDDLALEFVVKFERSAPLWESRKNGEAKEQKPAAATSQPACYFTLPPSLDGTVRDLIAKMQVTDKNCAALKLDAGKVGAIGAEGCKLLSDALRALRKAKRKTELIGMEVLEKQLMEAIADPERQKSQEFWFLYLEILQFQGAEQAFDDLAVEFAVTFELSPPAYEPIAAPATVTKTPSDSLDFTTTQTIHVKPANVFPLSGVITGSCDTLQRDLANFAAKYSEVEIDMAQVPRVDFVSVGSVLNILIELSTAGKKISIRGANEMIQALFGMMGIPQFAAILRKKAYTL
jgi:ABC-type transporter Mla MlaB component